jgi:hypothetical protein
VGAQRRVRGLTRAGRQLRVPRVRAHGVPPHGRPQVASWRLTPRGLGRRSGRDDQRTVDDAPGGLTESAPRITVKVRERERDDE